MPTCSTRCRSECAAENSSTTPKITASVDEEMYTATTVPSSAPTVVAISRNIPTRMFVYPSRTNAAAAPDEVAITQTSEAPIA